MIGKPRISIGGLMLFMVIIAAFFGGLKWDISIRNWFALGISFPIGIFRGAHGSQQASIIPDPVERMVRLPVLWKDGRWCLEDGQPLPSIRDGAFADLVIPAVYLEDANQTNLRTRSHILAFIDTVTIAFARVKPSRVPEAMKPFVEQDTWTIGRIAGFVKIQLTEPLRLAITPWHEAIE